MSDDKTYPVGADTWVNGAANRTGTNYATTNYVQILGGTEARRALLRPALGNLAGRTVLDAYLAGHAGTVTAHALVVTPITERWQSGKVTWENPTLGGPSVDAARAVTVNVPATAPGATVTLAGLGPMVQAAADGTPWHGVRLTTTATTVQSFVAADSGEPAWDLVVVLSDLTDAPAELRPDGGVASSAQPVLSWEFEDQVSRRVQVDTPLAGVAPDEAAPDFDSGTATSVEQSYSLAAPLPSFAVTNKALTTNVATLTTGTAHGFTVGRQVVVSGVDATFDGTYSVASVPSTTTFTYAKTAANVLSAPATGTVRPSSHTLVGAGPHFWRVQASASSQTAPPEWSDWAEITGVTAHPALIVDSPTGAFGDPSPTVAAHLASGVLSAWKVTVTGPSRADVRAASGLSTGPLSWTVPERSEGRRVLVEGERGWINIRAWDSVDRAVSVGDSGYAEVWVEAVFGDDPALLAPSSLMVSAVTKDAPQHTWRWARTEAADAWLIGVDGKTVARLSPEDVTSSAGVYEWTDRGHIPPMRPHTLSVKAVEGTKAGPPARLLDRSHTVLGVWLIPDSGESVSIDGTEVGGFVHTGRRATYEPLVGPSVDVIYDTNPGRTGGFEGSVSAVQQSDDALWATLDALQAMRDNPTGLVRLVWGSQSIRVRLVDLDWRPSGDIMTTNLTHLVSFGFVQVGA